jgi:nanoRNase/pAp phosphatase (c-di-AMP/oligoRNAs hydrolase)
MKPPKTILEVLESQRGKRHIIILHEYPDPDAIAVGYAHRIISSAFDIEADILYSGTISHPQNIALIHALDYKLIPFEEGFNFSRYDAAVFVDHQGTTVTEIANQLKAAGVNLLIVVDHHEDQNQYEAEYKDIRQTGSTATIYVDYLKQGLIKLDPSNKNQVMMATALMHGIITDTNSFIRASSEDLQAAAYLSNYRDAELLNLIMTQSRTKQVMDIIQRALENRVNVENFSIAGVGYLRAEDRDAIPEAVDFLLTEENVHTAIVYGIVHNNTHEETLVGSLRTDKYTLNPDEFIKDAFGVDASGHYFGGGKLSAGGFAIPIGFLSGDHQKEFSQLKWNVYDKQIKAKVLTKIGVDPNVFIDEKIHNAAKFAG